MNKNNKEILLKIMKDWYREAFKSKFHLMGPVYYHINDNELTIYTGWPGLMIGLHGQLVDKYEKILKDNNFNYDVKFIDLPKYSGIYEI